MISENRMLNKEINQNKGKLGYVPEPLLKRYHKVSMVNSEIWHTICILSRMIKQASRQSSIASNKGNDMHIHEILESVVVESIPGQQVVR